MSSVGLHVIATLNDGTVLDVRSGAGDLMRYELHSHRQNWPTGERGAFLQTSFIAWSAAKRQGLTSLKWDQFFDQLDDLDPQTEDDDAAAGLDPTSPAPLPG